MSGAPQSNRDALIAMLTDYHRRLTVVHTNIEAITSAFQQHAPRTAQHLHRGAFEPLSRLIDEIAGHIVQLGRTPQVQEAEGMNTQPPQQHEGLQEILRQLAHATANYNTIYTQVHEH